MKRSRPIVILSLLAAACSPPAVDEALKGIEGRTDPVSSPMAPDARSAGSGEATPPDGGASSDDASPTLDGGASSDDASPPLDGGASPGDASTPPDGGALSGDASTPPDGGGTPDGSVSSWIPVWSTVQRFGPAGPADPAGPAVVSFPALGVDAEGNALLAWAEREADPASISVYRARRSPASPWTTPTLHESNCTRPSLRLAGPALGGISCVARDRGPQGQLLSTYSTSTRLKLFRLGAGNSFLFTGGGSFSGADTNLSISSSGAVLFQNRTGYAFNNIPFFFKLGGNEYVNPYGSETTDVRAKGWGMVDRFHDVAWASCPGPFAARRQQSEGVYLSRANQQLLSESCAGGLAIDKNDSGEGVLAFGQIGGGVTDFYVDRWSRAAFYAGTSLYSFRGAAGVLGVDVAVSPSSSRVVAFAIKELGVSSIHIALSESIDAPWATRVFAATPGASVDRVMADSDDAGNVIVAWSERSANMVTVRATTGRVGGVWSTPSPIVSSIEAPYASYMQLRAGGTRTAVVAWQSAGHVFAVTTP